MLWRFTYRESGIEAGDAFVFCYPQGIELDGPDGVSGAAPALVEKAKTKYRVRNFLERGHDDGLGLPDEEGHPAPLIDTLHRVLWLMQKRPGELGDFVTEARPNRDQLHLIAQALIGPALKGGEFEEVSPTAEMTALTNLVSNWQSVIEHAELTPGQQEERRTGQQQLI